MSEIKIIRRFGNGIDHFGAEIQFNGQSFKYMSTVEFTDDKLIKEFEKYLKEKDKN